MHDKSRLNLMRVQDDTVVFAQYDVEGVFLGYYTFVTSDAAKMVTTKLMQAIN